MRRNLMARPSSAISGRVEAGAHNVLRGAVGNAPYRAKLPPCAGCTTTRAATACNIERGDTRRDVADSIVGRGGFRASRKESQPEAVDGEQRSTGHAGRHWVLVHRG